MAEENWRGGTVTGCRPSTILPSLSTYRHAHPCPDADAAPSFGSPPPRCARKIWDCWHDKASVEDVRATNVHFDNYKVENGLLMKKVLAGNAQNLYAVVVLDANTRLQRLLIKFYHEAAGPCGGIATWRLVRNKYVWKAGKIESHTDVLPDAASHWCAAIKRFSDRGTTQCDLFFYSR